MRWERSFVRVWLLFVPRPVRTDPEWINPALRSDLERGGGVPTEPTILWFDGGKVLWDSTGEVRTLG